MLEGTTMGDAVANLKTDSSLLKALRDAPSANQSAEERQLQRVSFVYGSLDSDSAITRERVKQILVDQGTVRK
jgi:hypothetical protein